MKTDKPQSGFTLLEVLISLAILTISLMAMVSVSSQRADSLLELRERSEALTVAHNVLQQNYRATVNVGENTGRQGDWYWKLEVVNTNNENITRLNVSVSKDSGFDYSQAQLTGFKWR